MTVLEQQFDAQQFANDLQLVNGVAMHVENPENFHIPPDVIKRHIRSGQFVELRIDSPRFSVHEDAPQKCSCPTCNGDMTKPILRHDHPASLVPLPAILSAALTRFNQTTFEYEICRIAETGPCDVSPILLSDIVAVLDRTAN